MKAARLVTFPSQENLGRLAAQGFRPARQRRVDFSATVAGQAAREAQQQEFLGAVLRRLAGALQQTLPGVVVDMLGHQLLDALAPPRRRFAAGGAFARRGGLLEVADQPAEIGHGEAQFGRRDVTRARRERGRPVAFRLEMPVDPGDRAGKQSIDGGSRLVGRLLRFGHLRHDRQEIRAADDSHDPPVMHHRHAFDAVLDEKTGDRARIGVVADGDDRTRHDVARAADRRAEARHEIGIELLAFRQQRQPPIAPRQAIGLVAADDVALADDAHRCAAGIDDRQRTDAVFEQQARDFVRRRVGRSGHHGLGHDIAGLHGRHSQILAGSWQFAERVLSKVA